MSDKPLNLEGIIFLTIILLLALVYVGTVVRVVIDNLKSYALRRRLPPEERYIDTPLFDHPAIPKVVRWAVPIELFCNIALFFSLRWDAARARSTESCHVPGLEQG